MLRKYSHLICLATVVGLMLQIPPATARDAPTRKSVEYEIKAGFICKFVKFCTWPDASFANSDAPITVGILGFDPFQSIIDEAVEDLKIKGRSFQIRRYTPSDDYTSCHILFISAAEHNHIPAIMAKLADKPILTISESHNFCRQGGMINFHIVDNKVRFQINEKAARRTGIEISTRLLQIADVVDPTR